MELLLVIVGTGLLYCLYAYARERRERELAERLEKLRERMRGEPLEGVAAEEVNAAIAASRAEAERIRAWHGRGGF